MRALHDLRQQTHDSSPIHRSCIDQVKQSIVILSHGCDMKHATNPWAVRETGKRQSTLELLVPESQRNVRRRNAIPDATENSKQVNQVSNGQVNAVGDSGDFGIETDAGTVRKVTLVAPSGIDLPTGRAAADSVCQQGGGIFPGQRNRACFGKIVASACRDDAELDLPAIACRSWRNPDSSFP